MVCVAGLPMHHWIDGDHMAEAYAMLTLVQQGYADQNEIAKAFGYVRSTLWRHQAQYEAGGLAALGRSSGRPPGTRAEPSIWVRTATSLQRNGMAIRDIAQRLKVSKTAVGKWLSRQNKLTESTAVPLSELASGTLPDLPTNPAIKSARKGDVEGLSLDSDPTNRVLDRLLARLGKLDDR